MIQILNHISNKIGWHSRVARNPINLSNSLAHNKRYKTGSSTGSVHQIFVDKCLVKKNSKTIGNNSSLQFNKMPFQCVLDSNLIEPANLWFPVQVLKFETIGSKVFKHLEPKDIDLNRKLY